MKCNCRNMSIFDQWKSKKVYMASFFFLLPKTCLNIFLHSFQIKCFRTSWYSSFKRTKLCTIKFVFFKCLDCQNLFACSSSLELRQPRRPLVVRRRGQRSRSPLKALSNQRRSWPASQLPVQRPAHQPPKVRTGILYDSLLRTTTFWLVNWTRFIWGLWIPPQNKNNQQTKSKISWNKLSTDFKFLNLVFFFFI